MLTDGEEGAEEEEGMGGGEEGTGVGVEREAFAVELWTSVLASKLADTLYRSILRLLLAVASSFGADLDTRHPMTVQYAVIMRTRLRQTYVYNYRGGRNRGGPYKVRRPRGWV